MAQSLLYAGLTKVCWTSMILQSQTQPQHQRLLTALTQLRKEKGKGLQSQQWGDCKRGKSGQCERATGSKMAMHTSTSKEEMVAQGRMDRMEQRLITQWVRLPYHCAETRHTRDNVE